MNLQFEALGSWPTSADLLLDPEKHVVARPLVVPNAYPEVMVEGKLLDRSRAQKINRRATARTPPTSFAPQEGDRSTWPTRRRRRRSSGPAS